MVERGDTELETRVKIAEMDITLINVGTDVSDMKKVLATVAAEIVALGRMNGLIAVMQETMNINNRRSDERWAELLRINSERDRDTKELREKWQVWREQVDDKCEGLKQIASNYRTGFAVAMSLATLVIGFIAWVALSNLNAIQAKVAANERLIDTNNSIHTGEITALNAKQTEMREYLMTHADYRPK